MCNFLFNYFVTLKNSCFSFALFSVILCYLVFCFYLRMVLPVIIQQNAKHALTLALIFVTKIY